MKFIDMIFPEPGTTCPEQNTNELRVGSGCDVFGCIGHSLLEENQRGKPERKTGFGTNRASRAMPGVVFGLPDEHHCMHHCSSPTSASGVSEAEKDLD